MLLSLFCFRSGLGYEAIKRFRAPVAVVESWMIWTSVAALVVNGGITLALVRGRSDLNLRSILVHNFGDALSNIAIIAGAVVIHVTGARWIDPLLGLAIGLLVLWSSIGILRESSHILLEAAHVNCAWKKSLVPCSPSKASRKSTTFTSGPSAASQCPQPPRAHSRHAP